MRKFISLIAGLCILGIAILYGLAGIVSLDPGEVALQVKMVGDNKGMQEETIPEAGLYWRDPIKWDIPIYDVKCRQYPSDGSVSMEAQTRDGQPVKVDISLEICLDFAKVPYLHKTVGVNYFERVVYPALRQVVRNRIPTKLSEEIYQGDGRLAVQKEIESVMTVKTADYGLIYSVNMRDINFTNQAFIQVLEQKASAAQQVIIEERNAAAEEQKAIAVANKAEGAKQKAIKEAEATKQQRILNAEGEREKLRLEGEGQRLRDEEIAQGTYAILHAEAEGLREKREAFAGPGGDVYASVRWAEEVGKNISIWGIPTGAPGTNSVLNLNDVINNAAVAGLAAGE